MKIYNFLGYSSYTGYADLKTNFKDPVNEEIKLLIWFDLCYQTLQFLGYSSYTGYSDLKTNFKDPLD